MCQRVNHQQQSGAVEACWAHNPEVRGSKPRSASIFLLPKTMMQQVTSAGECAQQKYRSAAVYGLANVLVSECEKLNF